MTYTPGKLREHAKQWDDDGRYSIGEVFRAHAAALEEVERLAAMVRELVPYAERWETLVAIWHEATELLLTQDEDGTWSIAINESVENAAGHWNGDTPDAAIDAARTNDARQTARGWQRPAVDERIGRPERSGWIRCLWRLFDPSARPRRPRWRSWPG